MDDVDRWQWSGWDVVRVDVAFAGLLTLYINNAVARVLLHCILVEAGAPTFAPHPT